MTVITDKLEVNSALILSLSLHQCSVLSVKIKVKVKATQKGEKLKQGCDLVTGDRSRDLAHRRTYTN